MERTNTHGSRSSNGATDATSTGDGWILQEDSKHRQSESEEWGDLASHLLFQLWAIPVPDAGGWPCHYGNRVIDDTNVAVVGFESQDLRYEEGEDIVIVLTRISPAFGSDPATDWCIAEEDDQWLFDVVLTPTELDGVKRVPDDQLRHRVGIYRGNDRIEIRIPATDNHIPEGDSRLDVSLVGVDLHSQIQLRKRSAQVEVWDTDPYVIYWDHPCGEPLEVAEGDPVDLRLKVEPPFIEEYPRGVTVLENPASAFRTLDYVHSEANVLILFHSGQGEATLTVPTIQDYVVETTERFELRVFAAGRESNAYLARCRDDFDFGAPSDSTIRSVLIDIIDDDAAVIDMGPRVRPVVAGEPFTLSAAVPDLEPGDRGLGCELPITTFWSIGLVDPHGELVNAGAVDRHRVHLCTNDVQNFTFETQALDECDRRGMREVRFRTAMGFDDDDDLRDFGEKVYFEHDEYVVQVFDGQPDLYAEGFTTGASSLGYTLDYIKADFLAKCHPADVSQIELWAASPDGGPLTQHWYLEPRHHADTYYPDFPGLRLEPDTQYFVVARDHKRLGTRTSDRQVAHSPIMGSDITTDSATDTAGQYLLLPHEGPGWTGSEGSVLRLNINAGAITTDPEPPPAGEPENSEVDWKTSITVGRWYFMERERERGWRREWCIQTTADDTPIEDQHPDDICYGNIADRDFVVGSQTFEIEGVYHMTAYGASDTLLEFEDPIDISSLLDREFVINGRTFAVADRYFPRPGNNVTDRINWSANDWNALGGWKVGSTIWIGLKPASSMAQAANTPATGVPAIDGTPLAGETLTATTTAIADEDGMTNAVFAYQWVRQDTDIAGATAQTYEVTGDDVGKPLKVRVTFTDDAGNEESLTSNAVVAAPLLPPIGVAPPENTPATGSPAVQGTPLVGQTLTATTTAIADEDGMADAVFAYQWIRHDPVAGTDADIDGESASTYVVTATDVGKPLNVRVSFTDDAGNEETLTSPATASVKPLLTASVHDAPGSHDGQNRFTFELRFSEGFGISFRTLRDHAFTVTGGEVTKARRLATEGSARNTRWEIRVSPDGDGTVTIVLPLTTDCDADGAICTGDGRMLSKRLEITVDGPDV